MFFVFYFYFYYFSLLFVLLINFNLLFLFYFKNNTGQYLKSNPDLKNHKKNTIELDVDLLFN